MGYSVFFEKSVENGRGRGRGIDKRWEYRGLLSDRGTFGRRRVVYKRSIVMVLKPYEVVKLHEENIKEKVLRRGGLRTAGEEVKDWPIKAKCIRCTKRNLSRDV